MISRIKRQLRKNRGFTLVELMIVVAIIGILAALAVFGVKKYLANSKSAEARNSLGQMAKDAVTAYDKEGMAATVLTPGTSATVNHRLCASATNTVPSAATAIAASKYQSAPGEWNLGDQNTGWQCLKFSMDQPQYFMYNYTSTGPTADFSCIANGDLDGDGTLSTFSLPGKVATTNGKSSAIYAPNVDEQNGDE